MSVGVVTGFTHEDTDYEVPVDTDQRKAFVDELIEQVEALDGVEGAVAGDATGEWDLVTLEVGLEHEASVLYREPKLVPNPRSLSPRLRNTVDDFTPVSAFEVTHTPTALDADDRRYEEAYYIVELALY